MIETKGFTIADNQATAKTIEMSHFNLMQFDDVTELMPNRCKMY
jgi:hypothetical protein